MNQVSKKQSRSFTIDYYQRLALGGGWLGSLDVAVQNWRHGITAFGGFDTATFELMDTQTSFDDWAANGIGRVIVASDDSLNPMWEGFVNSITISRGGLSITIGPLTDIANKVFAIYSGVDTSVYPPQIGVRKKTPTFSNLDSQALYGVWPVILSLAGVTDSNADQLVDMYLQEHGHAEKNSQFSFGGSSVSLSIDCLGWYHTLKFPFNSTLTSGTVEVSARIQEILSSQVNPGWVSSDYSNIQTNGSLIKRYQNDDRLALEYIRGYTAMGDASLNRWFWGVYEDRKAHFYPLSNQIDYQIYLTDPKQTILDANNAVVPAWRVRPGKWAFFADFMPGLGAPYEEFHDDPRMMLIEGIDFDIRVPIELQISAGHTSKYEHKSAKLGLRGIDV